MTKPVTVPNTFASQVGNVPASQLDDDYAALAAAINDTATYGNYAADTGAVNAIAVATASGVTFTYQPGVWLDVLIANTNTSPTVTAVVNGVGSVPVVAANGAVLAVGALVASTLYRLVFDGTNFRVYGTVVYTTGTFTGTLTGCTTSPTTTFKWSKNGDVVTLLIPSSLAGTSNATTCTITGLPAVLTPVSQSQGYVQVFDNGAAVLGSIAIAGTTMTLGFGTSFAAGGFTASGTKGLGGGNTITYKLT